MKVDGASTGVAASETNNGNVRLEIMVAGELHIKVLTSEDAITLGKELQRLGEQCF